MATTIASSFRDDLLRKLEPLKREYDEEKAAIDAKFAEAQAALNSKAEEIAMVEAAIAVLDGKKTKRKAANTAKRQSRGQSVRDGKPTVRQADVLSVCVAALQKAQQPVPKEKLAAFIKQRLARTGELDLKGIALRIKECWASNALIVSSDGLVTLSSLAGEVVAGQQSSSVETPAISPAKIVDDSPSSVASDGRVPAI